MLKIKVDIVHIAILVCFCVTVGWMVSHVAVMLW